MQVRRRLGQENNRPFRLCAERQLGFEWPQYSRHQMRGLQLVLRRTYCQLQLHLLHAVIANLVRNNFYYLFTPFISVR